MSQMIENAERFHRVYANLPLGLREDIIAVIDGEPVTWKVARLEISAGTAAGEKILEFLIKLDLI